MRIVNEDGGHMSARMSPAELKRHWEVVEEKRLRALLLQHWNTFVVQGPHDPKAYMHMEHAEASERLGRTRGIAQMDAFRAYVAFKRLTA